MKIGNKPVEKRLLKQSHLCDAVRYLAHRDRTLLCLNHGGLDNEGELLHFTFYN